MNQRAHIPQGASISYRGQFIGYAKEDSREVKPGRHVVWVQVGEALVEMDTDLITWVET